MKLYGCKNTRSTRAAWALEHVGAEYDYQPVDLLSGAGHAPEYLQINPGGKVPTLVDGDLVLTESAAICIYVAEKFPGGHLLPTAGSADRALCMQWCFFAIGELEQPLWTIAKHRFALPERWRVEAISDTALWEFERAVAVLSEGLAERPYMVGEQLSVADILIAHTLAWARGNGINPEHDNIEAYTDRLLAEPALRRARARELAACA